jgi:hypothetical protein
MRRPKLERLVDDLQAGPVVIRVGKCAKLVHRTPSGWEHTFLTGETGEVLPQLAAGSGGHQSRTEAIASAARHYADLAWTDQVADDRAFAHEALAPYVPPRDRSHIVDQLVRGWQFTRRYRAARVEGYDDADAHQIAGGLAHLVKQRRTKPMPSATS